MEYIFVIILIVVISFLINAQTEKEIKEHSNKVTVVVKECPPHAWRWQEIVDQDGVKQGERIVCDKCGPLSKPTDGSIE